jgi:phenylacetate-CoA ligase
MLARVLWYCYELSRNQWLRTVELRQLQEKRLRNIVKYAYNNVPLYREKFDAQGIKPEYIRSLEDIQKLPFTTKQEVRDGIPDRSLAIGFDLGNCIRASTSGTSGGSMPVFYDKRFMDCCMAAWAFRKRLAIGVEPWQKVVVIEYGGPTVPKKDHDRSTVHEDGKAWGQWSI